MERVWFGVRCQFILLQTILLDVFLVNARTSLPVPDVDSPMPWECPVQRPCYCTQVQTAAKPIHKIACAWTEGGKKFPHFAVDPGTIFSLSIIYNDLRYIPHDAFQNLKVMEIDLRGNRFGSRINGKAFLSVAKKLWSIKMDWCGITGLNTNIFRGMLSLRNLTLSQNKLKTLPNEIFHDLCRLRLLSLSGNPLHQLPVDLLRYQTN